MSKIKEMMVMQKELNDFVIANHGLKFNDKELLKNMILACHDEISEVEDDITNPEEFIDVLHFVLSVAIELGVEPKDPIVIPLVPLCSTPRMFRKSLLTVTRLSRCFKHWSIVKMSPANLETIREELSFMIATIVRALDILDADDIYTAYHKKYVINIERQKSGY